MSHRRRTTVYIGTGSPEGAVHGSPGDVYLRRDGSGTTTRYLKGSGTGVTGWTAAGDAGGSGTPATTVVGETSFGASAVVGAATNYAREDHTHGTPSLGTTGTTACAGNDARLSDARTPTAHAVTHQHAGDDEVATATAAANAIPKAGGGDSRGTGRLDRRNAGVLAGRFGYVITRKNTVLLPLSIGSGIRKPDVSLFTI